MNTEELQFVLSMIAKISDTGSVAFIAWLIAKYGSSFLSWFAFIVFSYSAIRVICQTISRNSACEIIVRNIRDQRGFGTSGILWEPEISLVRSWVDEKLKQEKIVSGK